MAENFKNPDEWIPQNSGYTAPRKFFHWKDFTLSYTRHGGKKTGKHFILIGGWTSAPGYWDRNLPYFLQKGQVTILDLLGHQPSEISENVKDLHFKDFLDAQSKAVLEIAGKEKVILVGHSTGGLAVLGVAALFPDIVSKVVAIAPVVYGPVVGLFKTAVLLHRIRLGFVFELGFSATQLSENFLEQGFARGVRDSKRFFQLPGMKGYLERYFPEFKKLSGRNMNLILEMLDRTDLRPLMLNYKTKTLLVRSLNDPIVPPESSDHLAKDHACIREVLFNDSGHFVHLEQQEDFESVLGKFLSQRA
jgi:pimeloyl-ACP methyl ester carboxylesterase